MLPFLEFESAEVMKKKIGKFKIDYSINYFLITMKYLIA